MPASRSARAMIFAPRSCPSRPGLAIKTRIRLSTIEKVLSALLCALCVLCGQRCWTLNNKPAHTVLQYAYIKIDQQPDPMAGEAKVGEDDGLVNWCEALDGLQFNDHP